MDVMGGKITTNLNELH